MTDRRPILRGMLAALFVASALVPALAHDAQGDRADQETSQQAGQDADRPSNQEGTAGSLTEMDREFVNKAAAGGMTEIVTGRLASQRGASADVKAHGQKMVDDHVRANSELLQLASSKGVMMSDSDRSKHARQYNRARSRLERYTGEEFDRNYLAMQIEAHEEMIALFQRQSETGSDADLKAWAAKMLPALREHLEMTRAHAGTTTGAAPTKP